jgi:hypothetical protein
VAACLGEQRRAETKPQTERFREGSQTFASFPMKTTRHCQLAVAVATPIGAAFIDVGA